MEQDRMLEYIFFDESLRDRFMQFAHEQGVACQSTDDQLGLIALLADDLPDDLADRLEVYYDRLMDEQAELIDQAEGGLEKHVAAIRFNLADGKSCLVKLEPALANRLLACFTLDEVQALFAAVENGMANPNDGPLCKS